jgi:hypothetical protein
MTRITGLILTLLALLPSAARTQSASWETVNQSATWLNGFVDHAVSDRTALWFDGHWRRMGVGNEPQQLLLRPGIQVTLRPGLRAGAGYAYIATAPYGGVPSANPVREQRAWQQLSLAHRTGPLAISHRVRWEQRWVAPLLATDALGAYRYQQRARYSVRAQRPIRSLRRGDHEIVGFVWDEFFFPVGHSDARDLRLQNRVGAGIGIPLNDRQRVELGYMHQWNRVTPAATHEFNHTLVISWIWTAGR